ncbi:MAG: ribosome biogenesis factor YjgA [Gammaproteobacteria bacterium]|nr:DUF615 domain-containing protein [Pseudomonadales bacterium]MCP5345521.1 DUF615 domain-containing protein [Pseudomonadales bacterium]
MEINDEDISEQPSKTRRKKEMHALQAMGARLTGFSEAQLNKLTLPDSLRNAIREYNRLPNSHGARRRQMQFIGRLMRDFQLEEIEQEIERILHPPQSSSHDRKLLEEACHQVLTGGDDGIIELIGKHGQLDRQILRRLFLDYQKAEREGSEAGPDRIREKLAGYLKGRLNQGAVR